MFHCFTAIVATNLFVHYIATDMKYCTLNLSKNWPSMQHIFRLALLNRNVSV
jgi:hypothetical protein